MALGKTGSHQMAYLTMSRIPSDVTCLRAAATMSTSLSRYNSNASLQCGLPHLVNRLRMVVMVSVSLVLDTDTIVTILAATRGSNSWKACQMEGTSWDGTAEENIQKYVSSVGIDPFPV